jgi:hypothetical protein
LERLRRRETIDACLDVRMLGYFLVELSELIVRTIERLERNYFRRVGRQV